MVLGDIGFQDSMHAMMEQVVAPLVARHLSSRKDVETKGEKCFQSQHSFIVRYRAGEDEDLKTHRDDADVTLNICLGKCFRGADVYFHESPQACSGRCSAKQDNAVEEEFAYPHPSNCKYCTFVHQHTPGTAILHLGRHVHGVNRLESGERVNLIIWCRYRPYPPEMI